MKKISEYDEHQLKLMSESLDAYEKKQISLSTFVGNLEFLFHTLEDSDETWDEKFTSELADVEYISALDIVKAAGEGLAVIEEPLKTEMIKKSLNTIRSILREY